VLSKLCEIEKGCPNANGSQTWYMQKLVIIKNAYDDGDREASSD